MEKRRNDFKTEGEYISKILNRNIKVEFVNQMKRELKQLTFSFSDGTGESFDQVSCKAIPGCDELNEKIDELGVEGVLISQKTEKFLTILNLCHLEIIRKVYKDETEDMEKKEFEQFCYDQILLYFKKRTTKQKQFPNVQVKNVNTHEHVTQVKHFNTHEHINTHTNVKNHNQEQVNSFVSLPQFAAVLLNDLNVSIVFCSIHFKNLNLEKLKKLCKKYFENFLTEQKEEIFNLISDDFVDVEVDDKSVKRIALFLSRLEKVLKPLMLKKYFKNLKFILLNFSQELIWKNFMKISDISIDEISRIIQICKQTVELEKLNYDYDYEFDHLLKYKKKLICYQKILNLTLIEIINSYHRKEFKEISDSELSQIIKSVFAYNPLRNEFIKELELGHEYTEYYDDDNDNDENDSDNDNDNDNDDNDEVYY